MSSYFLFRPFLGWVDVELLDLVRFLVKLLSVAPFWDKLGLSKFIKCNHFGFITGNCIQLCVKEVINEIFTPTAAAHANDGTHRSAKFPLFHYSPITAHIAQSEL